MYTNYANTTIEELIEQLADSLLGADAIIVGAGSGLSLAAGFNYDGARFEKWCAPWKEKYGFHDFYSAGFYPFPSKEEFWGFWSTMIMANRYECSVGEIYTKLKKLLDDKDYFVITTNVDHQFQLARFDKKRLFYTQGDYGLFQCSKPCCQETFDNESEIRAMYKSIHNESIASDLIPKCPYCESDMTTNLRIDNKFVQDKGWHQAANRYSDFLHRHSNMKVLYLELGVGSNTPGIIKYPFWQMTSENKQATYACINMGEAQTHPFIADRSICIDSDINTVVDKLLDISKG